jgi:predicted Rossmann fold flavoprotein
MKTADVIVIGGGPAGMFAAGRAAERGRKVVLLEKNNQLGKKLELTGGGRCNITHAEFDTRALLSAFGDASRFLFSPFSRFSVEDTFEFFETHDLPLIIEEENRAFPETERATDVIKVLAQYLHQTGVQICLQTEVKKIVSEQNRIVGVKTNTGELIRSESVILATGGTSYPKTGSTGDGLRWLSELGHTTHPSSPSLVPLRVKDKWLKNLSGTSLDTVGVVFTGKNGKSIEKKGPLLFTHFGLSGPMILNSSTEVKKLLSDGPVPSFLDLFPNLQPHELEKQVLELFSSSPNKIVRNVLRELLPAGTSEAVAGNLPGELTQKKIHSVTKEERRQLLQLLKNIPFTVTGTMGYDWAIVSEGGVDLKEIDTRTMCSRKIENLYVSGDLIHLTRPCGGFSLQLCWTTGFVAGDNA